MQARLEEEEANKAALVERINRLTRLILVSTQDFRDESSPKVRLSRALYSAAGLGPMNGCAVVRSVQQNRILL